MNASERTSGWRLCLQQPHTSLRLDEHPFRLRTQFRIYLLAMELRQVEFAQLSMEGHRAKLVRLESFNIRDRVTALEIEIEFSF